MSRQGSMFKITITLAIVSIVLVYTIFNSRLILKGPEIHLFNVVHGQSVEDEMFEITGKAENVSFISLNGRPIFINQEHVFKEKVLLTNRLNPISIYAKDKFGKETQKDFVLVYEGGQEKEEKSKVIEEKFKEVLSEAQDLKDELSDEALGETEELAENTEEELGETSVDEVGASSLLVDGEEENVIN